MYQALDHDLIHEDPYPLYVGELPTHYRQVPATVVVNLCGVFPPVGAPVRVVLSLPFLDVPDPSMLPERAQIERFLDGVHAHARAEASYWHCHAGINRANFVAAAYLHRHRGMRIGDAIALLRKRRSDLVLCNPVFEHTLRAWYGAPDERAFEPTSLERYLEEVKRHLERAEHTHRRIREDDE